MSTVAEGQLKKNPMYGSGASIRPPGEEVARFHHKLPGYRHTPLVDLPMVANALNLGRVLVKVESNRLNLPSFKMLGASWATYRALLDHTGMEMNGWDTLDEFVKGPQKEQVEPKEVDEKTRSSGKYDHLYTPGMTAKEKQKVRAKARRAAQ